VGKTPILNPATIVESAGYWIPFEILRSARARMFSCTYEAEDVHLNARPLVAVPFDNLQRIAPGVKKVGRQALLSY
jgi:hypothetical protein